MRSILNRRGNYDFKPLGLVLVFLLFMGLIFPYILSFFISVDEVELSPNSQSLYDTIDNGFEVDLIPIAGMGEIDVNPFSWLGDGMKNNFLNALVFVSVLPSFLVIFISIISVVSILYALVKMVLG